LRASDRKRALRIFFPLAAGNVTADSSRRRDPMTGVPLVVRMTYDSLNRLKTRTTPTVRYGAESCAVGCIGISSIEVGLRGPIRYPYFVPPRADGVVDTNLVLLSDIAEFTYDAMGRLKTANNREAKIYREYYPNGALKLDSLRIAVYDRSKDWGVDPYSKHGYALRYAYDLSGSLQARTDGVPVFPGNVQSYDYDVGSGLLTSSSDKGTSASFKYDAAARLRQWSVGSGFTEMRNYNDDDQLETRTNPIYSDELAYDARGKVLQAQIAGVRAGVSSDTRTMAYTGLGALAAVSRLSGNATTDQYTTDGFGNVLEREAKGQTNTLHRRYVSSVPNGERLDTVGVLAPSLPTDGTAPETRLERTTYGYDVAGNQTSALTQASKLAMGITPLRFDDTHEGSSLTRSYYDGEDRLRLFQESGYQAVDGVYQRKTTVSEYRYDALGRRILVRTLRDSTCASASNAVCPNPKAKLATLERFVWDGDQLLYEYRGEGGIFADSTVLEEHTPTDGAWHGAVHYFHAGGIDQPLALCGTAMKGSSPHLMETALVA
jgi:hypothetical protein